PPSSILTPAWMGRAGRKVGTSPGPGQSRLAQDLVRIDRRAFPPVFLRRHPENGEMEVRRRLCGVAGSAYETNGLAPVHDVPFLQAVGIPLEVRVIVGVLVARIELIDGVAARLAEEQLRDHAVLDGDHRRIPRREDVERLVLAPAASR